MDELRESSLLFSLEGLLETERERVQREAREAQRRREEELARVAELAERRRLATQHEREARERRQLLEQERERLEQERTDAMKRATIERARIETEAKVRLVEAEQVRKHDLALSQLREGQRTTRYRSLTWLSTAALGLSVTGAAVAYFGWMAPLHARQAEDLQRIIGINAEQREQARTTERMLVAERSKNQALSERIDQLEARLNEPTPSLVKARPAPPTLSAKPTTSSGATPTSCPDDGDPLRGCLVSSRRRR